MSKPWTGRLPDRGSPMRLGFVQVWVFGPDLSIHMEFNDCNPVVVTGIQDETHLRNVLGKLRGCLRETDR